jgi:hypothetical protein
MCALLAYVVYPGAGTALPAAIEIGTITTEPADSVVEAGVVATATQVNPDSDPGLYTYTLALDIGSTVMVEAVQPDGGSLIFTPSRTRYVSWCYLQQLGRGDVPYR